MYCPNYPSEDIATVITIVQQNISKIINQLSITSEPILYEKSTDLTELAQREASFFLLRSGQVELKIGNKLVLVYEEGDLIGVESLLPIVCGSKSEDFAIQAIPITFSMIEEKLGSRVLLQLVSNFSAIFFEAFASNLPAEQNLEPQIKRYDDSQIIVEQGSFGDDIYTLIEGRAEAFVDGKKVGEVKTDEVFGALAAMTNIGRTATIKSSGKTLVLGIKKDQLIELIKMRPGTVEKLIGDLARVIQDLNKKLSA